MHYRIFNTYSGRHVISLMVAVSMALLANNLYSFSHEYWMVLTTFLVCQTTRGTQLRQAGILFTMIIIAVLSAYALTAIAPLLLVYIILSLVFILSACLAFIKRPLDNKTFLFIMFFAMMLLIATLAHGQVLDAMRARIIDIVLGAFIGIACAHFIFPIRLANEFRAALLPILNALSTYTVNLATLLKKSKSSVEQKKSENIALQQVLQAMQDRYPEWVYEVGFNPGLRSGFRFFLINLEWVIDLLFALDYFVAQYLECDVNETMASAMSTALQKNNELLNILIVYLAENKLSDISSDFTSDIKTLEQELNLAVPNSLELLDIAPDYVILTTMVRDIKDMRHLLLQLVMSLPTGQ